MAVLQIYEENQFQAIKNVQKAKASHMMMVKV